MISKANPTDRNNADALGIIPRVVFIGGYSRPSDKIHLSLIKLIKAVSNLLDNDEDTKGFLKLIFL